MSDANAPALVHPLSVPPLIRPTPYPSTPCPSHPCPSTLVRPTPCPSRLLKTKNAGKSSKILNMVYNKKRKINMK